jgi:D-alanyl-D-alanine carboxypeptidase
MGMGTPILRGRNSVAGGLLSVFILMAVTLPADACQFARHWSCGDEASPLYAAIVVDANSGSVLQATNADELRRPASLAKIMTLYLLFERLKTGKLKLHTALNVSEHAAAQAPTRLGLKPDETIMVEDAIKALVTKSANDIAVVIAEAIAGSERDFAELMTRKAQALGMSRTIYRNASGLPDDEQVTTARDQALLGRAIQERFPRYYHYFGTQYFSYHGLPMRNHNQLLGRVDGVDGIKTGYTQVSGFNLVASVRRNDRHIASVVLGGASADERDTKMRSLIEQFITTASTQHTAPAIGDVLSGRGSPDAPATYAVASYLRTMPLPAPVNPMQLHPTADPALAAKPQGDAGEISPIPISPPASGPSAAVTLKPQERIQKTPAANTTVPNTNTVFAGTIPRQAVVAAISEPNPDLLREEVGETGARTPIQTLTPAAAPTKAETLRSGSIIQVGAFESEQEARQKLSEVHAKWDRFLANADGFVEAVSRSNKTFYRARFAGFKKGEAEAVCRQLKPNNIDCMTVRKSQE